MKHKFLSLFIAIVASIGTMFASVTINGIAYELYAPTATVVSGGNYTGTIVIPSSVEYNSAIYSVTSIGEEAFRDCTGLTAVTIPNSVTSIGKKAFRGCTGLTSVTIPNSVTSIGEMAFYACSGLTSPVYNTHVFAFMPTSYSGAYTIPDGIEIIAGSAFRGCSSLTSVTIPNSVTSIGELAFYSCRGLTSVTIGNSVTSIGELAFAYCSSLTSVTIPNSVTNIGESAFQDCSGLTSVTIPNSVTSIGEAAFDGCDGLTSPVYNAHVFAFMPTSYSGAYTIADGIESIAGYAFRGCSGLRSVTIPNSVTSIGNYAFRNCSSLISVTIPNSVTSIGNYAFCNCSGLTSVTIGNGVTSIADYAFYDCSSLTSVTIPNSVTGIGFAAFLGCSSLASVTIPNSVTSIGDWAFCNCSSLTSVTIPNSVTSIGESAFSGCSSLTSVTIPNSVTSIGQYAFNNCSSLTSIYVPCGEMERFKQLLNNDSRVKYAPLPYTITINATNGNVTYPQTMCDDMLLNATPDYGYHFVKWSDGNTANPRAIELTRDTTFAAEFAKNTYTISTTSANPEWGTTAGGKSALYQDEVEISATPNYGYHFVRWNDYNTSNPRIVSVTEDKTYTATFAKNVYSITKNAEHGSISGNSSAEYLDFVTLTVTPDYGYHFTQWSDGNTDNPRTITLTSDTTFTAQFAKNSCSISLQPDQAERGSVSGAGTFEYLDEKQIEAIANYGYHFTQWSDGVADNPRTIVLTQDTSFVAQFAKNTYTISLQPDMAEHGSVSGSGTFEYLDEKQIEAIANYGYHFTAWSDGVVNNPRVITLVGDTTFTALFDVDKSGTCGDYNALTWTYNDDGQLTISGNGTLNSNYTFGVEAPISMRSLIIESGVSSVGNAAFKNQTTLNEITISHGVNVIKDEAFAGCAEVTLLTLGANLQSIGANAFDGCKRVEEITVYAERVIDISATTFANIGNKKYVYVYVPEGSLRKYERDEYWSEFDLHVIGATGTTVEDNQISVATTSNTADVTWPAVTNAVTYELAIKDRDGNAICTLIFNAQGQLTSIAFAAPGRPQQAAQTTGFTFTVTGLDSGSKYGFTIDAKDENGVVLDHKSGSFETTSSIATGIDNHETDIAPVKVFRNGEVLILRNGKTYTVQGQEVR